MDLAGIEDDICENRDHLVKLPGFLNKLIIHLPNFWPKFDTCHGEFTLKSLLQVIIQLFVLFI